MTLQDDLTTAAAKGDAAGVEALLRKGADVNVENSFGRRAIQVMMMGSTAVASILLRHQADPNVADRSTGTSPLHDAAREGFTDTVKLLLQAQADPRARDSNGRLPADLALENGHTDIAELLQSV
ncbi:cyclin-dependent kinase 4 inhibitor B [Kryptolebias marmoratus]|uniref:Cyclin dependent kinase inhibitor 2A n=1 Tax=Kryptolebias marmoratus TaxID=37003 RepID=A0A3Q2ZDH8_KRYMA|nr:cyclin-dependent kinase 4 inhibitor B [Kryptolebias marmoratus]